MLDEADKQWLRELVTTLVATPPPAPIPRLTVKQFAAAVGHHPDVINRWIRVGRIPDEFVFGEHTKKISPKALGLFGVTPQEARSTLEARNLLPAPQPSGA